MSYILDALRRADAERSRGAVPGLHAQSLPAGGEPDSRKLAPLIWAGAAAAALVVAGVLALMFGPWRAAAPAVVADASRQAAAPRRLPAPQPMSQPGAVDPASPAPAPPEDGANVAQRPQQQARPLRVSAPEVERHGVPGTVKPAPAASRADAVSKIDDLPPELRAQLPRLSVGGAIYSDTPSARMVILNGQVFHEGDRPAADTVLEQIRLKSAVLNFRGRRYEVSF